MTSNARRFAQLAASGATALAMLCTTAPAQALTINLIDLGGVTGSQAEQGFKIAAKYWESVLSNNVTVNLGVGYASLAANVIGSTSSTKYGVAIEDVEAAMAANGNSAIDAGLVVPALIGTGNAGAPFGTVGTIGMVRNSPTVGALTNAVFYDANNTKDNGTVAGTAANLKALGYTLPNAATDAKVTFSTNFAFDFNPMDGITNNQMDFIGVAIHEIGHALGFTSGVDTYDFYGPLGPNAGAGINWDGSTVGNILDLFRYSNDPNNVAPGAGPVLDWSFGTASYFSVDGGLTQFNGYSPFSTGVYNGDGRQASHFKDLAGALGGCNGYNQIGIMDPTFCYGEMGVISATDLAAFDAIGWNINFDVLANHNYQINTKDIFYAATAPVPEPASWAMMIGGFALAGGAMRRRRATVSFA